jgi:hypothetical protein
MEGIGKGLRARLVQNFLEEVERAGILALTEPEDCGLPQLAVRVGASDPDERRNSFVSRALGEGKDSLLPDFPITSAVARDRIQGPPRGGAGRLPQPEKSRCAAGPQAGYGCERVGAAKARR